jgi:uncharacterized protein (TIGR03437 family)
MGIPTYKLSGLVVAFSLLAPVPTAFAQQTPSQIKSFSVGPDTPLTYPDNPANPGYLTALPDEHTTFIPPAATGAPYLVFAAGNISGGNWGAVVLQTTDLKTFDFATAQGYQSEVLTAPLLFGQCTASWAGTFDENYAAPGSVVQDPTLPAGNLIMVYEAENHCPGGVNQFPFYGTTGFARSSDNGKTWPAPENGVLGGPTRYPVLQTSDPPPTTTHGYLGDAIPSAFVDKDANNDYYLYITYTSYPTERTHVARAQLGVQSSSGPLNFLKWYNGSFSQPGIGGSESPVTSSPGCPGSQFQSEINYNDDLGLYLLIFVCESGSAGTVTMGWYYSTATSLDLQDWTAPQMILNSQYTVTTPCPGQTTGDQVDGLYPSMMSPGAAEGHTKLTGYVFFFSGCSGAGTRQMMSRTFTITPGPAAPEISLVANAEGESPTIAPNTWVEIKGSNLAPAGDSRIWQGSDFVNGQMPTQLDGVSVTVNGKSAYVYYISPTQVNILTPPDTLPATVAVQVANNGATSTAFSVAAQPLTPSFFVFNGGPYAAATHLDGSLVGPPILYAGLTTPAKPGETVVLYGNGFGPTSVLVVSGAISQSGSLSPAPAISVGGLPASVQFAGLVAVGQFQFNVIIPAGVPTGDAELTATYGGLTSPLALLTIAASAPPTAATLYVAPNGNDSWTGALASPNGAGTDGPLATFDHARAAVRALNKTGLSQVSVQFRAGTYFLAATEQMTAVDSGTANLNIVYQNFPGESPVISGGIRVTGWTNVNGNTWQAALPDSTQYFENLYYNHVRRLRPRLGGYLGTYYRIAETVYLNAPGPPAATPDTNCPIYVSGSGWECFDRFQYNPADPISSTWKNLAPPAGNPCGQTAGNSAVAGDIELVDFEKFGVSKQHISCVDTTHHIVYLYGPTPSNAGFYTALGYIPQHRYLVENVADALTQPGQWFLDRSTTPWTLTYLANPGENPNNDTVIVPQLSPILVASNLAYVTFQGLTFAHDNFTVPFVNQTAQGGIFAGAGDPLQSPEPALTFQNSQYITFDTDVVAHTAGAALEFLSCLGAQSPAWCVAHNATAVTANNTVQNSAFYDLGGTSVRIGTPATAADTDANLPQYHTVQNNVVEGYGRLFPTQAGITQYEGHHNTYTHNDVYDGYHMAIGICLCSSLPSDSHDNVISFNHVYNLFQGITNDGGSLYIQTGNTAGPTPTGNKILNNKVHDVSDASVQDVDGYGGDGIYIDNLTGSVDVENNLVYRVSDATMNFAEAPSVPGEPTTVKNNIFAFARGSLINVGNPYPSGTVPSSVEGVFSASSNLFYFDRSTASTPVFYAQGGCEYSGGFPYTAWEAWNSNLYWRTDGGFDTDPKAFHYQTAAGVANPCSSAEWAFVNLAGWQKIGEDVTSVVQNPGFNNPAYPADDYSLPRGSPGVGFVVFDASQAGRSNPVIQPPAVPATFPTKTFNPATDY